MHTCNIIVIEQDEVAPLHLNREPNQDSSKDRTPSACPVSVSRNKSGLTLWQKTYSLPRKYCQAACGSLANRQNDNLGPASCFYLHRLILSHWSISHWWEMLRLHFIMAPECWRLCSYGCRVVLSVATSQGQTVYGYNKNLQFSVLSTEKFNYFPGQQKIFA